MDDTTGLDQDEQIPSDLTRAELEELVEQKVREQSTEADTGSISRRSLLGALGVGVAGIGSISSSTNGSRGHTPTAIRDDSVADFEVSTITTQQVNTNKLKLGNDGPAQGFKEIRPPREVYVVWNDGSDYRATSDSFPAYKDPDPAVVIQSALDELDGEVTGYDENGNAQRPGGGAVLLTRGHYEPGSPITLRKGTRIIGTQPDLLLGKNNHEYQYCVIRGTNLSAGDAIIESEQDKNHVGIHNLHIAGNSNNVYGIRLRDSSGTTFISNVVVTATELPGYYTNGAPDNWLENVTVKNCGNSSNPAVKVDNTTQNGGFRWLYGRISNDSGYSAVEHNASLLRFKHCTIKSSAQPSTTPMPVINHNGSLLELTNCVIDGYQGTGSQGITQSANNQLRLWDSLVEKCDVGLYLDGNRSTSIDSVKIRDMNSYGIYVNSHAGQWDRVDIFGTEKSGIVVDGANVTNRWSNVKIRNWDADGDGTGYAIDIRGVKGGKPGDVPVIDALSLGGVQPSNAINNPQLCIVDGEWVVPYTYSLNGTDGSIEVSTKPATTIHIRVKAGGSPVSLQGITSPTRETQTLIIEHAGSNTVSLNHNSGSASNPLLNQSGTDDTLDSNGEQAGYRYDSQTGVWRQMWINAQ